MLGRAVTVFRNSVTKSKSSNTLSNSDKDEDDDTCNESIVSSSSISSAPCSKRQRRGSLIASRLSLLGRPRRSQSATREGDEMFCYSVDIEIVINRDNWGE